MGPARRLAGLAALALGASLACASVESAAPSAAAPSRPLLWSAAAPAPGEGSLYLLGSLHMGTSDIADLGPAVASAWEDASELVVEVDLSRLDPVETALIVHEYGVLPAGRTLRDVLTPETYARLEAFMAERAIPRSSYQHLKPWLASTLVTISQLEEAGLEADYGVDQQLIDRASDTDKPIVELESFQSQMTMFDELDLEVQELMLEEALLKVGELGNDTLDMVASWKRGDEEELIEVFFATLEENPHFAPLYEKVFYERNETMSDRLEVLARDGKTRLVVIGAGHMVGPRGIPALLASRGFRVDRVESP